MKDLIIWLPFLKDGDWTESVMTYCKKKLGDHVSFSSSAPSRLNDVKVIVPEYWKDSPYLRDFVYYGQVRKWKCFIFGAEGLAEI